MIKVFIGVDLREMVSAHVLAHSIWARARAPVEISFLTPGSMPKNFTRKKDSLATNEFSDLRFMVPYLSGFEGWSIFMDCDMLCRGDILELWDERNARYAVQVAKHDHQPKEATKYLGTKQTLYPKKNWSSVMLFNNPACRMLTPEYINVATGLELHQFKWLPGDQHIGDLPKKWNHLVGYYPYEADAKLAHFTTGGPWFAEYSGTDYALEWFQERDAMLHCDQVFYPNLSTWRRHNVEA